MSDESSSDPQPQGLDALRRYQYAPKVERGKIEMMSVAPAGPAVPPSYVSPGEPGLARRCLPYIVVICGAYIFGWRFSGTGAYRAGELVASLVAFGMLVGGGLEIAKSHLHGRRYLPWIVALVGATIIAGAVQNHFTNPFGGGRAAYPANVQSAFLAACENGGGSAPYCGCVLTWLESHKSLTQWIDIQRQSDAGGGFPSDVVGAIDSCKRSQ